MIEVTQTYEGTSSKCITIVRCDICYKKVTWGPNKISKIPKAYLAKFLLKREGWSFGKVHKCSTHSPKE